MKLTKAQRDCLAFIVARSCTYEGLRAHGLAASTLAALETLGFMAPVLGTTGVKYEITEAGRAALEASK